MFKAQLSRDLKIAMRHKGAWLNPLVFAVMVITLFSFALGPDALALKKFGPAIVWVVALLGIMLSLESLFSADYDDGTLEQMLMSGAPSYGIALAKIVAHWLVVGLPLVLATPLFLLMLGLPMAIWSTFVLGLVMGTGVLCFIGAVGASVTMSLRSGGALVALIILPFYVPVIIFGASLFSDAIYAYAGGPPMGQTQGLLLLTGLFLLSVCLCPFPVAWGLESSVNEG